jgi:hypothetical protein
MGLRARRLQEDYESEVKRRIRKEEDLKDAEAKIDMLQKHLKALEIFLEASSKRSVPARSQDDCPEMHAVKRSKVEEVNKDFAACTKHLESYNFKRASSSDGSGRRETKVHLTTMPRRSAANRRPPGEGIR